MLDEVKILLEDYAERVVNAAKNNLAKTNNANGELYNSLKSEVSQTDEDITVTFQGTPYANFYDQGVQGADPTKMPDGAKHRFNRAPLSKFRFGTGNFKGQGSLRGAIDQWVVQKPGLSNVRDDLGRFIPRKTMVFLISRSIYLAGLKPSYFFSDPFEFYTERLERELEDALDRDVKLAISQTDETNELIITIN